MSRRHPALPPAVSRPWLLGAVVIWVVTALIEPPSPAAVVDPGPFRADVTLTSDLHEGKYGNWAIGSIGGATVLVDLGRERAARGDTLRVHGALSAEPGRAAGRAYDGVLDVDSVEETVVSTFLPHRAGSWIRRKVLERLEPFDDRRALLAGFLIGDTSRIDPADVDAMRRSGLAHFVAVSGSNVALFLGLLAVVAGPLALGPRRRALVGLLGLPAYVAATRFEPSVLRASLMAGIALGGRLIGIVLEAWQLLALAVAILIVVDPSLTWNVGFQLSVAATAGVLVGARLPTTARLGRALTVTLGAQLAVAPLLLVHFGTVPLLSPLVNVVAAPLVAAATISGALGVAVPALLVEPAAWLAGLVLWLARGAAAWPQLGPWGLAAIVAAWLLGARLHSWRPIVVVGATMVVAWISISPGHLGAGSVVVLDVGQGDAILISGGDGEYALVDGGPDPGRLLDRLRRYGVERLDLVVVSHPHADHVSGIVGIVGRIPITELWADVEPHSTPAAQALFHRLETHGVPVVTPEVGDRRALGSLQMEVLGPVRRYASPNDQSIVLEVIGARTMLLSGDIETFAQAELGPLRADVLKVPHQGAATSDREWLQEVGADLAIISVGPNDFGHPVEWVIETLEGSGATVMRTDEEGDIRVDLHAAP